MRWILTVIVVSMVCMLGGGAERARAVSPPPSPQLAEWNWPVQPATIVAGYRAPAHRYAPGHRGTDLAAPAGAEIMAPAGGVVAFSGSVAGRPLVTIDHGEGLVTTLEPVSATIAIGTVLHGGDVVGVAAAGGHAPVDSVHFGVREHGEYINPLLLMGLIPRAVLLPCC